MNPIITTTRKEGCDLEKDNHTREVSEYKDLPEVNIDPENEKKSIDNSKKKTAIILGLLVILIGLFGIVYFMFQSRQEPAKPVQKEVQEEKEEKEAKDTTPPTFVGMQDRIVVELNALDVDLTKYFLAVDDNKQADIQVKGDVNLGAEGEYPITVIATDENGNTIEHAVTVQVISENTMSTGIEFSCYIDGSIPLDAGTKERLMANVIYFYYQDQNPEILQKINELQIDVSQYPTQTTWHPSMQQTTPTA